MNNYSVYLETQTYQSDLKLETLQAEFLNHLPYFALERMSFLMVSLITGFSNTLLTHLHQHKSELI